MSIKSKEYYVLGVLRLIKYTRNNTIKLYVMHIVLFFVSEWSLIAYVYVNESVRSEYCVLNNDFTEIKALVIVSTLLHPIPLTVENKIITLFYLFYFAFCLCHFISAVSVPGASEHKLFIP